MTAQGSVEIAVEAVRRGANDFIGKPFDVSAVVELLRRYLDARKEAGNPAPRERGDATRAGGSGRPERADDHGV